MPTPEDPAARPAPDGWLRRVADRLRGDPAHAVLDAVPTPFLLVDPAGTVEAANAAAGALLGVDPGDLVGADFSEAAAGPDRDALRARLAAPADASPLHIAIADVRGAEVTVEVAVRAAGGHVGVGLRDLRGERAAAAARDAAEGRLRMLRTIVDALPDPVEAVDPAGRVVFRNQASFDALPEGADPRRLPEAARPAAEAVLAAGEPAVEVEDAGTRVLHTARVPVRDQAGAVAGLVVLSRDVTAEKAAEAALRAEAAAAEADREAAQAERAAAEAAARAHADVLATTSHEIRTLMSGVTGMTALLLDTALDAEQRECVDTIRSSGEALLTLVGDVLDLSKLEAGRLELEDRPFRVRGLVGEAVRMVRQQAEAKGLALAAEVADGVPEDVHGDPLRVKQVLVNLLSNAVKFTDAGSIHVRVGVEAGAEGPVLAVAVRDTGVGVAPDQLAALFEPFAQADASTARTRGGTGLGLSICRRLVEAMGGALDADSAPGEGSEFRFTVPVRVDAGAGPVAAEFAVPPDSVWVDVPLGDLRAAVAPDASAFWRPAPAEAPEPAPQVPEFTPEPSVPEPEPAASEAPALFDVPLGDGAATPPEPVAPPPPERAQIMPMDGILPSARVLLAEDNPLVQKVTKMTLLRLGYRPDVVADGVTAVAAVRQHAYDVVLMDVMMPRMDGLEATRRIRADCGPHPMPAVVALTANAMKGDRDRCLEAGCDDYLAKPVAPQVLAATIERAIRARTETPAAA